MEDLTTALAAASITWKLVTSFPVRSTKSRCPAPQGYLTCRKQSQRIQISMLSECLVSARAGFALSWALALFDHMQRSSCQILLRRVSQRISYRALRRTADVPYGDTRTLGDYPASRIRVNCPLNRLIISGALNRASPANALLNQDMVPGADQSRVSCPLFPTRGCKRALPRSHHHRTRLSAHPGDA